MRPAHGAHAVQAVRAVRVACAAWAVHARHVVLRRVAVRAEREGRVRPEHLPRHRTVSAPLMRGDRVDRNPRGGGLRAHLGGAGRLHVDRGRLDLPHPGVGQDRAEPADVVGMEVGQDEQRHGRDLEALEAAVLRARIRPGVDHDRRVRPVGEQHPVPLAHVAEDQDPVRRRPVRRRPPGQEERGADDRAGQHGQRDTEGFTTAPGSAALSPESGRRVPSGLRTPGPPHGANTSHTDVAFCLSRGALVTVWRKFTEPK